MQRKYESCHIGPVQGAAIEAGEFVGKLVTEFRKGVKEHRRVLDSAYGLVVFKSGEAVIPQVREKIRRIFGQGRLAR